MIVKVLFDMGSRWYFVSFCICSVLLIGCAIPADVIVKHKFIVPIHYEGNSDDLVVKAAYNYSIYTVATRLYRQKDSNIWTQKEGEENRHREGRVIFLIPPVFLFYNPDGKPIPAFQLSIEGDTIKPILKNVISAEIEINKSFSGVIYKCHTINIQQK